MVVAEVHSVHYFHGLVPVFDSEEGGDCHQHPPEMAEALSGVQSESEEIVRKNYLSDTEKPRLYRYYTNWYYAIPVHQGHSD